MKLISSIFLLLVGQILFGQDKSVTFTNYGKPLYSTFSGDTFYSTKIHEIILNPKSAFEFWSRPQVSCKTWRQYKGTWRKDKDTLIFSDNYEVIENDSRVTYKKDLGQSFFISFKTDKNSDLSNKGIKVEYFYDYDAHLENSENEFVLKTENTLEIPFKDIPNLSQLASIRIEYQLDFAEKRYSYITEYNTVNVKQGDIPNVISVEFVEKPKREIVYRTIKGVIRADTLVIVSINKTKTVLPEYYRDIEFEDSYVLVK
jgi:hypothetical protein